MKDLDRRNKKRISVYRRDWWGRKKEFSHWCHLYFKHLKRCQDTGGIRKGKNGTKYVRVCWKKNRFEPTFYCAFIGEGLCCGNACSYDAKKCAMEFEWVFLNSK